MRLNQSVARAWQWARPRRRAATVRSPYAEGGPRLGRRIVLAIGLFALTWFYIVAFQLFGQFLVAQFALPLALIGLLVIWALPDRRDVPLHLLSPLLFAFLIALLIWPNYLAVELPGLPWISAQRLTGLPLLATLLLFASISPEFRRAVADAFAASPVERWLFIALMILITLSALVSSSPVFSLNKLIVLILSCFATLVVAVYLFRQPGKPQMFAYIVWGAVMLQCAIAVVEVRLGRIPWAGHIPAFLQIDDEAVQRILSGQTRAAIGIHRAQAKFNTPLGFAELLALGTPFVLHIMLAARSVIVRVLAGASLPVIFYGTTLADSRLGAGGFLLSFMLILLFWSANRWHRDRTSIFGPAITLAYPVLLGLFVLATLFVGRINNLVWGTRAHQGSNDARADQWASGIQQLFARPWGHGIGTGAEAVGITNAAGDFQIDSYYLSVLVELGVVGFILFYGLFAVAAYRGGRAAVLARDDDQRMLIPASAALINFIIIKFVLSEQENHPLMFITVGLVIALIWRVRNNRPDMPATGEGRP